jgi:hypothetical protein
MGGGDKRIIIIIIIKITITLLSGTIWHHISGERSLHKQHCEKLSSTIIIVIHP